MGKITYMHICSPREYTFQGWTFEDSYTGPWPLKKNGELRERCGRKFWKMYDEFDRLPNKEEFRTGGGCKHIPMEATT